MSGGAGEHTPIPADVVERMVALVRSIADAYTDDRPLRDYPLEGVEARAIAALLPPPVDPDLIEARRIAAVAYRAAGNDYYADEIGAGVVDDDLTVQTALTALQRGRELERGV